MVLGAVLAVCSSDLKRTLACSSISQIGFILCGLAMQCLLGEHNALAVDGTILHIVNHSLIKMALFPAAGIIYLTTHSFQLDDIQGFGRGKPLLAVCMGPVSYTHLCHRVLPGRQRAAGRGGGAHYDGDPSGADPAAAGLIGRSINRRR